MAAEIMLVNPRRRRARRKTSTRRRRAPARRRTSARRKAPSRRRRRRNPSPPGTYVKRAVRRRRRRNPAMLNRQTLTDFATAATKGAAGAVALDVALAYVPMPAEWKSGLIGKLVKGAGAIALGAVSKNFGLVSSTTARDMTIGALTVQFAGIGRDLLAQVAPGVALSAYLNDDYAAVIGNNLGYAGSGWNPSIDYDWTNGDGLSAYNVGSGDIAAPGYGQPGMNDDSGFGW